MIYAGLYGLQNRMELPPAADINLFTADQKTLSQFRKLPENLNAACKIAKESKFIKAHIPPAILDIYCHR